MRTKRTGQRAIPATARYAETFRRLTSEGWTLRSYGQGWRYFSRIVAGAPLVQAPNSHEDAPATMQLHECCRISASGAVEAQEPQLLTVSR